MKPDFETALMDLIADYQKDGTDNDTIMSCLELRLYALREEGDGLDD